MEILDHCYITINPPNALAEILMGLFDQKQISPSAAVRDAPSPTSLESVTLGELQPEGSGFAMCLSLHKEGEKLLALLVGDCGSCKNSCGQ